MRVLSILLCVAASGCAIAPTNQQAPRAEEASPVEQSIAQGKSALNAEQWAEAALHFSSAYEQTEGEARSMAAVLWGYSLRKQAESVDQTDPEMAAQLRTQAQALLEEPGKSLDPKKYQLPERVIL